MTGWLEVPDGHPWSVDALPYGVVVPADGGPARVAVAVGDQVLDLTAAAAALLPEHADLFAAGSLDRFLAAGRPVWSRVRAAVREWLTEQAHRRVVEPLLRPAAEVTPRLAWTVADYVDFYASREHATNLGRILRPGQDPLPAAWLHLPIGYHGRAGTVVVSGTPVRRPRGQRRTPAGDVEMGPTTRLDLEAELGFVVGVPSVHGEPVPMDAFDEHVFGLCLVNDWSARDIQAFEYVPLGPFLGKSFATSVSAWLLPLEAMAAARVDPPRREQPLPPYLDDAGALPYGLDVAIEVSVAGTVVSRPCARDLYWTGAQMLAHLTVNGASVRTGDLYASGTVSSDGPRRQGSLIELTHNATDPLVLPGGRELRFLEDGDEVRLTATAPGPGGRIGLGEVRGTVRPAARSA